MKANEFRKAMEEYGCFHGLRISRSVNVAHVCRWPCMQGQGLEAASWMEVRWAKLVKFAAKHGYRLTRWDEK